MYLSGTGASSGQKKLSTAKATLNPNATEFVPFALRSPLAGISSAEASTKCTSSASSTPGKGILDASESSVSNISDDEAQQYWHHQLPDDITPDFKVMGIDDAQGINSTSFSRLSLADINGPRNAASTGGGYLLQEPKVLSPRGVNGNSCAEKSRYPVSSYREYPLPTGFYPSPDKPRNQPISRDDLLLTREGSNSKNSRHAFMADMPNEQLLVNNAHLSPDRKSVV